MGWKTGYVIFSTEHKQKGGVKGFRKCLKCDYVLRDGLQAFCWELDRPRYRQNQCNTVILYIGEVHGSFSNCLVTFTFPRKILIGFLKICYLKTSTCVGKKVDIFSRYKSSSKCLKKYITRVPRHSDWNFDWNFNWNFY